MFVAVYDFVVCEFMISAPCNLIIYVVQYSEEYVPPPPKKNVIGGGFVQYIPFSQLSSNILIRTKYVSMINA